MKTAILFLTIIFVVESSAKYKVDSIISPYLSKNPTESPFQEIKRALSQHKSTPYEKVREIFTRPLKQKMIQKMIREGQKQMFQSIAEGLGYEVNTMTPYDKLKSTFTSTIIEEDQCDT